MLTLGIVPLLSFAEAYITKHRSFPKEHLSEEPMGGLEGAGAVEVGEGVTKGLRWLQM